MPTQAKKADAARYEKLRVAFGAVLTGRHLTSNAMSKLTELDHAVICDLLSGRRNLTDKRVAVISRALSMKDSEFYKMARL